MSVTDGREVRIEIDALNEQVVIGATIAAWSNGVAAKMFATFAPDHFLANQHRAAWAAMREMHKKKLGWDLVTLKQIGGNTIDEQTWGLIADLADKFGDEVPANLDFHVKAMLFDRSKATALEGPIAALIEALRDPKSEPERIEALARQIPASFKSREIRRALLEPRVVSNDVIEHLLRRREGPSYPYCLDGLDWFESYAAAKEAGFQKPEDIAINGRVRRMFPGTEPGYMTLLTGESGSGKSSLAATIALNMALRGRKVLYCAWEPMAHTTLESIACQKLGWSRNLVQQGQLTDEYVAELKRYTDKLSRRIRFMDQSAFFDHGGQKRKRTNEENLDIFAHHVAESGCDIVIADLWKYALVNQDPYAEEEALKRQQVMCKDLNFHLILLQQQGHKRFDRRDDRRPTREGIKGSGAYLETADTVIAPYLPSQHNQLISANRMEVHILKQRYGRAPICVEFEWNQETGQLSKGLTVYRDKTEEKPAKSGSAKFGRGNGAPASPPASAPNISRRRVVITEQQAFGPEFQEPTTEE